MHFSKTLIDTIFTNNICKPHKAGILVTPISDRLMQFCVIIGKFQISNHKTKYVEIESLNPQALNNFKTAINKLNIYDKLETSIDADPNKNDDILANVLAHAKLKHLPKKHKCLIS